MSHSFPQRFARSRVGYVYFARQLGGHYIKIGFAANPDLRVRHWLGVVLAVIPVTGNKLEQELHAHFSAYRVGGEWFEPTDELLNLIADYADVYADPVA